MPSATAASMPELDDGPPFPSSRHPHHRPATNPLVTAVIVACAYEIVATGVNVTLGAGTMPLLANGINAFTWRAVGRRLVPAWALPAGLVGVGFVLSAGLAGRARRRAA